MQPSPTLRPPSDRADLYAWHTAALAALKAARAETLKELSARDLEAVPRTGDDPQCGWFAARISRVSVLVPARIWVRSVVDEAGELVEPEVMLCEVGDRPFDPGEVWPKLCIRPIPASEYRYLMSLRAWAKASAPEQPQAVDGRPVDWMTVQIPPIPAKPVSPAPKRKR
jgi:hypothetical protein